MKAQNKAMKANPRALEANNGGAVGEWLQAASLCLFDEKPNP